MLPHHSRRRYDDRYHAYCPFGNNRSALYVGDWIGAASLGKGFRIYLTLIILILFGTLTGMDAPGVQADLPTPRIGIWECLNIGGYMLWVVVLAVILLGMDKKPARG